MWWILKFVFVFYFLKITHCEEKKDVKINTDYIPDYNEIVEERMKTFFNKHKPTTEEKTDNMVPELVKEDATAEKEESKDDDKASCEKDQMEEKKTPTIELVFSIPAKAKGKVCVSADFTDSHFYPEYPTYASYPLFYPYLTSYPSYSYPEPFIPFPEPAVPNPDDTDSDSQNLIEEMPTGGMFGGYVPARGSVRIAAHY